MPSSLRLYQGIAGRKRQDLEPYKEGMNSKETNEEAAPKTGLNHLFTDETTDEAVISVDATATEVSSYATGASFQDYVYWK